MNFPSFRAIHSADWRPEAPEAAIARLVPKALGRALVQQMPGCQVGRTVVLSLLLASCAYRQDAARPSPTIRGEDTATPDSAYETATLPSESSSHGQELPAQDASLLHSTNLPRKRRVEMTVPDGLRRMADAETAALLQAWNGRMADELPALSSPDIQVSLEATAATQSPSSMPAPAAVLLDIDRESAGHWLQLSPWYALPVVLALGMPLVGVMGRRSPRRQPAPRRDSVVPFEDTPPPIDGQAADDAVMVIPMGMGSMARVPWSPRPDPLSRENWSIGLAVRFAPLDEKHPPFLTRANYATFVGEYARATEQLDNAAAHAPAQPPHDDGVGSASRMIEAAPVASIAQTEEAIFAGPEIRQPVISEELLLETRTFEHPECEVLLPHEEHPAPLIPRLQAILANAAPDLHVFLDLEDDLPVLATTDGQALPAELLVELESMLLEVRDDEGTKATWLLTQVLAMRMAHVARSELDALYHVSTSLVRHGTERASHEVRACWQARLMELDLALAARQSGASRLLALRNMAARHAAAIDTGDSPVLRAWIEVLLYWADCQLGDSALARFTEAAAMAKRLSDTPRKSDEGQRLLADVLRRRAGVEHGGVRARTLAEAQRLLDELFARTPTARIALAVAEIALERGRHAPSHAAGEAFSHALTHAFLAGSDPRWHAASLRLRLSIQLAYEALPDMPVQGSVALDLARKLDRLPAPPGEALGGMALAFIRQGEHGRACRLCAEAWHAGTRAPNLLETWQQASVQWARNLTSPSSRSDWHDNERLRRVATQMQ